VENFKTGEKKLVDEYHLENNIMRKNLQHVDFFQASHNPPFADTLQNKFLTTSLNIVIQECYRIK